MFFNSWKKNKIYLFLLISMPFSLKAADLSFSEIMFDPKGSDTDREWVEIKNNIGGTIDLEKYKFCDSGSCHKFFDSGSGFKIPPQSFGVFAKNPAKFKEDYPNFSGFILRSSFSLTNSKELLELKNSVSQVLDVVEYNSEVGGTDGDSFSLFGDTWKNGKPTPGGENVFQEISSEENNENEGSNNSNDNDEDIKINRTYVEISDVIDGKKKLKAEIVDNISTLIAGAKSQFDGRAYGITGIEIKGAEYFWNFGDGKKGYGKKVHHTYLYPGEYVLTLLVKSSNFSGHTRRIVKVAEPQIEISAVSSNKNWIKLKNNYSDILKLDNWFLMVDGEKFEIPQESYILPKKEIIFPNEITKLDVKEGSKIFLLFPNGEKVTRFVKKEEPILKNLSFELAKNNLTFQKKETVGEKINNFLVSVKKPLLKKELYKKENFEEKKMVDEKKSVSEDNNRENIDNGNNLFNNVAFMKRNFSLSQDKNKKNNQNTDFKKELKIKKDDSFWLENIYFIIFIIFNFILVVFSVILKNFEDDPRAEISEEALEYDIEEL